MNDTIMYLSAIKFISWMFWSRCTWKGLGEAIIDRVALRYVCDIAQEIVDAGNRSFGPDAIKQ